MQSVQCVLKDYILKQYFQESRRHGFVTWTKPERESLGKIVQEKSFVFGCFRLRLDLLLRQAGRQAIAG